MHQGFPRRAVPEIAGDKGVGRGMGVAVLGEREGLPEFQQAYFVPAPAGVNDQAAAEEPGWLAAAAGSPGFAPEVFSPLSSMMAE